MFLAIIQQKVCRISHLFCNFALKMEERHEVAPFSS